MIRVAICEDDKFFRDRLEQLTKSYMRREKIETDISVYSNGKNLEYEINDNQYFDILLSDVEMPQEDGLQLATYAKRKLPGLLIIFITAYLKYAADAFEKNVFRLVPKEELELRFERTLEDAVKMVQMQTENYYRIETPTHMEKILYRDILYIKKDRKTSLFTRQAGNCSRERKTLSKVYADLNPKEFIYIERGIIVNLSHIIRVEEEKVIMSDGEELYPSAARMEELRKRLSEFWGEQIKVRKQRNG